MKFPSLPGRVLGGARYNQHRDQRNDSERETIYESRTRSPNQHAPFHLASLSVGYLPPNDDEHPHASVTRCGLTYDKDSMAQVPEHRAAGERQEVAVARMAEVLVLCPMWPIEMAAEYRELAGSCVTPFEPGSRHAHSTSRGGQPTFRMHNKTGCENRAPFRPRELLFDRCADQRAPLRPGAVIVADVGVAQKVREHEPGVG